MKETLIIAGFGGQGVLSMGKILAYSGVMQDFEVTWMPSYGPEMRGGTANVTGILSDRKISSPIAYQYDTETGIIKNATLVSLGTFKTTAYCPCRSCSEGYGRLTKTGTQATASRTVAVDPRVIPLGSHLLIDGVEYIAEDVGGGVKGKHIDIFYNTHSETKNHGVERSEVYLIQS